MLPASLALAARTVWPVGAAKELQVQNICTCTARAQCSPTPLGHTVPSRCFRRRSMNEQLNDKTQYIGDNLPVLTVTEAAGRQKTKHI